MFINSRPTNLRCWTTEGIWCGKRGGNYNNDDDDMILKMMTMILAMVIVCG